MSVIGQEAGIEHGTDRGYNQHRHRQIPPCKACRKAHTEANNAKKTERGGTFDYPARPAAAKPKQPAKPVAPLPPSPWPPILIGDAEIGTPIKGIELEVGDWIVHLGRRHRIERFREYTRADGGLRPVLGPAARIAVCEGGFELPFGLHSNVYIAPRGDQ